MTEVEPEELLASLTLKQVEVLDLLLQHKTTKQIARELGIAPNTVDARIAAVREKWRTSDRKATARAYAFLLESCGKSPCGFSPLDIDPALDQELLRDLPRSPLFTVADAQFYGHWPTQPERPTVLEALDARFGMVGRLGAILGLAMVIAMTLVTTLAIAQALGDLI